VPSLSAEQWVAATRRYGLLGDDLSETDCMRAFGWSRAISSDPYRLSARGGKEVLLSFECFLELVCHLARLKAFPTAEEMQAAAAAATEAAAEGGAAEQAPNTAVVAGAETVSVVTGGLWIASDRCWPLLVPVACHLLAVASFVSDRCF